jgi:response regulator NasT
LSGIIVVFPKLEDAQSIKHLLIRNGYSNVTCCTSGAKAINMADNLGEGIIVSGYKLPDMPYREIYENVGSQFEMLLITSMSKESLDEEPGIAMLEMPLKVRDFLNSVEMMDTNIYERLHKKKRKPGQRSPEEQQIIDEAKKILMEMNQMSEQDAHRYIQKSAMDSGRNMVETASMILTIMDQD